MWVGFTLVREHRFEDDDELHATIARAVAVARIADTGRTDPFGVDLVEAARDKLAESAVRYPVADAQLSS